MERVYDDSKRVLEREMQEIANKGTMSKDDLMNLGEILDNLKDISIICAMEEESGYSERMMYAAAPAETTSLETRFDASSNLH